MVGKSVLNNKGRVTGQREVRPVWNNAQRVNHQNKLTHPHTKRNFVPTTVATKSGLVPVNAARQSSPSAATSISIARHVNTVASKPKVNAGSPTKYSYFKAHSPLRRSFNQKSAAKTNNFSKKVYTIKLNKVTTAGPEVVVNTGEGKKENVVKSSACWIWRPTGKGNPQYTLQDQGIFDSGCSRHMTGNKSYLTYYQDIDGGFVAFAGSPKGGKITRKGDLTCLFAKAIIDESNLWHRRLGHINFKTMNKLVRETLLVVCLQSFLKIAILVLLVKRESNIKPLAEAVNTACYVQNRVLVTKPHNTTPYELLLVTVGNQTNKNAGIKDNVDAVHTQQYILLPLFLDSPHSLEDAVADDAGKNKTEEPANEGERNGQEKEGEASNKDGDQNVQDLRAELDKLLVQQKEAYANSTNRVSTISPSVSAAGQSFINADDLSTDPLMPAMEDTTDLLNTL
ncbi:retrovirus-related pol polyprotein from transposon TNT 1-94 [Tanacetum coccineum]